MPFPHNHPCPSRAAKHLSIGCDGAFLKCADITVLSLFPLFFVWVLYFSFFSFFFPSSFFFFRKGTFYTAYTASGTRECAATLAAPVYFGGAAQDGTPNSEKFFGTTLTAKLIDSTTAVPSYTTLSGCETAAHAWGLFKSGSGPAPPSPGPPPPPSPGPPGPPQCTVDPGKRTDCGFSKTESECEAAGCCYQTSDPSTFRCYDAGTPDVCQQIDPGKRIDCGYTDTKEQCEAAGCCYDGDTPFTFHCFCKNAAPPAPPSPAPATAAAQCVVSDPNPPPSLCAVICVPGLEFLKAGDGGCMTGASCQAIQGTGVCTYPDSNAVSSVAVTKHELTAIGLERVVV